MARIRSVKPEFWGDEKMAPQPDDVRLLFLGLICMADDAGRLLDSPKQIEAFVWPHEERPESVRDGLATLSRLGRIRRGVTASGQHVIQIVHWGRHQRVDHPNLKAALPEIVEETSVASIRESVANGSRKRRERLARDSRVDLRPTTSDQDQRPTTKDLRAAAANDAAAPAGGPGREATSSPEPEHWVQQATALWEEHVGVIDHGRLGKRLRKLVHTHGWPKVREALEAYVRDTDGPKAKPRKIEWFAEEYRHWERHVSEPIVDESGVLTAFGDRVTRPGA